MSFVCMPNSFSFSAICSLSFLVIRIRLWLKWICRQYISHGHLTIQIVFMQLKLISFTSLLKHTNTTSIYLDRFLRATYHFMDVDVIQFKRISVTEMVADRDRRIRTNKTFKSIPCSAVQHYMYTTSYRKMHTNIVNEHKFQIK